MGFSRQENWSGLAFATLRDLPDPGIELVSQHTKPMGVAVFQYNFIDKNVQLLTKMEGWIWTCDPSPSQLMWMLLACGLYFLW